MTDALAIDPPAAEATLETIERVYRERGPAFLRVATAITGEGAAAHDAVQDGFALAIRHRRPGARGPGGGRCHGTARARRPASRAPAARGLLRYYADLDYAAIGTALGIGTGTVSATLAAGLRSLRRMAEEVEL